MTADETIEAMDKIRTVWVKYYFNTLELRFGDTSRAADLLICADLILLYFSSLQISVARDPQYNP